MRFRITILLPCVVVSLCCGGGSHPAVSGPLTGNWQLTLQRHGVAAPLSYTGFLLQNGSAVSGNLILGACGGVGPVRGTVDGQNVTLTVNEFGQDLSLVGTLASGTTPMGGQFSSLAGACTTPFTTTGTWTATPVPPLKGNFTGTLTSRLTQGLTFQVTGAISQGPNTGDSTAPLSGTMTSTTGGSTFCPLLTTASITGLISGQTVTLNLYAPDGSWIAQISGSVLPDATALSGSYNFQQSSGSCGVDNGTLKLTFQ